MVGHDVTGDYDEYDDHDVGHDVSGEDEMSPNRHRWGGGDDDDGGGASSGCGGVKFFYPDSTSGGGHLLRLGRAMCGNKGVTI